MAVPKKKRSYTKCSLKYNNYKLKKLKFINFWVCNSCLNINKPSFSCTFCSKKYASWKTNTSKN